MFGKAVAHPGRANWSRDGPGPITKTLDLILSRVLHGSMNIDQSLLAMTRGKKFIVSQGQKFTVSDQQARRTSAQNAEPRCSPALVDQQECLCMRASHLLYSRLPMRNCLRIFMVPLCRGGLLVVELCMCQV